LSMDSLVISRCGIWYAQVASCAVIELRSVAAEWRLNVTGELRLATEAAAVLVISDDRKQARFAKNDWCVSSETSTAGGLE
jgi:hypothetical protein